MTTDESAKREDDDWEPPTPRVTGSPNAIWLQYGDIEEDCTHDECYASGEVTWCQDEIDSSDVKYVRADIHERVCSALEASNKALRELHALVWGECPSLLNEDSGGDAKLDLRIREILAPALVDGKEKS